jgi:hypothetical protein
MEIILRLVGWERTTPDWENAHSLIFEDQDLVGPEWIALKIDRNVESGEPLLVNIKELKRLVKTL